MKFPHDVSANFKFVGSGTWWNDTDNVSVSVNEDYRRTFAAYLYHRPHYRFVVKNKNGNAIRFRSAEAAAKHVLKLRAAFKACIHNEMVPTGDPTHAWQCAACGHVYGK